MGKRGAKRGRPSKKTLRIRAAAARKPRAFGRFMAAEKLALLKQLVADTVSVSDLEQFLARTSGTSKENPMAKRSGKKGASKPKKNKPKRSAAQRAATKRMLAANKKRGGGRRKVRKAGKKRHGKKRRSAAQRAATARMLRANKKKRGGGKRKARKPGKKKQRRARKARRAGHRGHSSPNAVLFRLHLRNIQRKRGREGQPPTAAERRLARIMTGHGARRHKAGLRSASSAFSFFTPEAIAAKAAMDAARTPAYGTNWGKR